MLRSVPCSVLAAALLACSPPPSEGEEIVTAIEGTITDAETAEPLAEVRVQSEPQTGSFTTTSDGRFRLDQEVHPDESYTIVADRTGYMTSRVSVTTVEGVTQAGDIALSRLAPVLEVLAAELRFDAGVDRRELRLANGGPAQSVLRYELSSAAAWVSRIEPESGEIRPGDLSPSVDVHVDRAGVASGTHRDTLSVRSNGGDTTVNLTLIVP